MEGLKKDLESFGNNPKKFVTKDLAKRPLAQSFKQIGSGLHNVGHYIDGVTFVAGVTGNPEAIPVGLVAGESLDMLGYGFDGLAFTSKKIGNFAKSHHYVSPYHEDHALIANAAYTNKTPEGFTKLDYSNRRAKVYKKDDNGDIYIGYRGTDPKNPNDLIADGHILLGNEDNSSRFEEAEALYKQVKRDNPDSKIHLTGHSLAGAISQYVGERNKVDSVVTFASGVNPLIRASGLHMRSKTHIVNYSNAGDPISVGNFIPRRNQETRLVTRKFGNDPHTMENYLQFS